MQTGFAKKICVYLIAVESSEKIVMGGGFATFNGFSGYRIVRLYSDGSFNFSFASGFIGVTAFVRKVLFQTIKNYSAAEHLLLSPPVAEQPSVVGNFRLGQQADNKH